MRVVLTSFGLGLAVALAAMPARVAAQGDFDDAFDDSFEDEFGSGSETGSGTPEPAAEPEPAPSGSGESFEDAFSEEFGDDDAAEDTPFLETDVPEETEDAPTSEEDAARRARLFRMHNTLLGPTGGIHVVDAHGAPTKSFRLQLATEFFFTKDFIENGDQADHIGGTLSLSWGVHENLELFASLRAYSSSNDQGDPELLQVLGDASLGVKGFYWLTPFLSIGGDLTLALLNTVGDIGLVFKSTSVGLRANMTADLRGLPSPIPFIARFNLQYFFDNSEKLIEDVEDERYANLPDARAPRADENRHLVTAVERFGLNINRTDFFNMSLGFESPLEAATDFYISPILEWTWNIPANRQGYDCLFIPDPSRPGRPADGEDGCLKKQGPKSFPMDLTVGVRLLPPVDGLAFLLAADIGLTGQNTFVRELAPNHPYNIILGASYAYDTRPRPDPDDLAREVVREVEVPMPPAPKGRIHGIVVEQGAPQTVVEGATIRFTDRDLTALVTGRDGGFTTYLFEPGETVNFAISHPDYTEGSCVAEVPPLPEEEDETPNAPSAGGGEAGAEAPTPPVAEASAELLGEVTCELVALPRVGHVEGRVVNADGRPVTGAQVSLSGAADRNATSGEGGSFRIQNVPPGDYAVQVEADDYLIKVDRFAVETRETARPIVTLVPKPRRSTVQVTRREIRIRRQINFATDSARILPSSEGLMAEIADVLIRNPHITKVEIQGHTDNRGGAEHNLELSQQRADAVRQWLIEHGVAGTRLDAKGYGQTNPLVPNITPANRARNRRVQFEIVEQSESTDE